MSEKGHSLLTKILNKKIENLILKFNSSKFAETDTITFFKTRYIRQKTWLCFILTLYSSGK